MTSVVTNVPNLLREIDIFGSVGGWLSNPYDALQLRK